MHHITEIVLMHLSLDRVIFCEDSNTASASSKTSTLLICTFIIIEELSLFITCTTALNLKGFHWIKSEG